MVLSLCLLELRGLGLQDPQDAMGDRLPTLRRTPGMAKYGMFVYLNRGKASGPPCFPFFPSHALALGLSVSNPLSPSRLAERIGFVERHQSPAAAQPLIG